MKKRLFAILLTLAVCLTALPVPALAVRRLIGGISVWNLEEPCVGEMPAATATVTPSKCTSGMEIHWSAEGWDESRPFEAGRIYTVTVSLKVASGYELSDVLFSGSNAMINDRYAQARATTGGAGLELSYTFPVLEGQGPDASPFTDVIPGSYYEEAVAWAREKGVTAGTTETTFSPQAPCTRGQVVTFLWRALGCPEPAAAASPFTDVSAGDYYYKSVLWAVEQGITAGTSATAFSPDAACTGAHVITFLHRASGTPAPAGYSPLAAANGGTWYTDALAWAESSGLLEGVGDGFAPGDLSPRADIVTYLYRTAN